MPVDLVQGEGRSVARHPFPDYLDQFAGKGRALARLTIRRGHMSQVIAGGQCVGAFGVSRIGDACGGG
jgi:hypothetical protein